MDPVSLAASIITLIGATTVTSSAISRLWGLRGLPLYVASAINEVNDFKATLKLVHTVVDDLEENHLPLEAGFEINRLLARATTQLEAFNRFLKEEILREGEDLDGKEMPKIRKRAKLKEVLGDAQVHAATLQQELMSIKVSLSITLGTIQLQTVPKLLMSIQQISVVQPGTAPIYSTDTNTLVETAAIVEESITESHIPPNDSLPSHNALIHASSVNDSKDFSRQWIPTESTNLSTYLMVRAKSLDRKCVERCSCQCHIPFQGGTPRWLQSLVGTAFFKFTGTPVLNYRSCNVKLCGNSGPKPGSVHLQYLFPTWLLRLGIEVSSTWKSLEGPGGTWTIRIPRLFTDASIIPELWDAMKYGTPLQVRQIMDTNGIRAFDICHVFDTSFKNRALLRMAASIGRPEICSMLIDAGADPGAQSQGLSHAQYIWRKALRWSPLRVLLDHPKLTDEFENLGFTHLHLILLGLAQEKLEDLIKYDPKSVFAKDCFGFTPLHWAASIGDIEAIESLLGAGADVNAVGMQGRSVLSLATRSYSTTCCEMLLDAGANIDACNDYGENSLFDALRMNPEGAQRMIALFIARGINTRHRNYNQQTCLTLAAQRASVSICEQLLESGADIDAEDFSGYKAITHAIRHNNYPVIEDFLRRQADSWTTDDTELSVQIAGTYGDVETLSILRDARLQSSYLSSTTIDMYWDSFDERDRYVRLGDSRSAEEAEFVKLLDSLVECHYVSEEDEVESDNLKLPGAFPCDPDDRESGAKTE